MYIRVAGGVESELHFIQIEGTVLVSVECCEGLSDYVNTIAVKFTQYGLHEFVETEGTASVLIEDMEHLVGLRVSGTNAIVLESLLKFRVREFT